MRKLFIPQLTRRPQKRGKLETALQQALLAMLQQKQRDYNTMQFLANLAHQAQQRKQ